MLEEEVNAFYGMARTADHLARAAEDLKGEAMDLAVAFARAELSRNLEMAIARAPEFQHEALTSRLRDYFYDPERVRVQSGAWIVLNVQEDEAAMREWLAAQQAANEDRKAGREGARGWAASPSPAQRAAYWRREVYGGPLYESTLEERFAYIDDAPFWYFLEYGTGELAYPTSEPTLFLTRTRQVVEGNQLIRFFSDEIARALEEEGIGAIDDGYGSGTEETVSWSRWYQRGGRWVQHQYNSRGFTGVFRFGN